MRWDARAMPPLSLYSSHLQFSRDPWLSFFNSMAAAHWIIEGGKILGDGETRAGGKRYQWHKDNLRKVKGGGGEGRKKWSRNGHLGKQKWSTNLATPEMMCVLKHSYLYCELSLDGAWMLVLWNLHRDSADVPWCVSSSPPLVLCVPVVSIEPVSPCLTVQNS